MAVSDPALSCCSCVIGRPGGGKETVKMSGDLAARVSELEARNSELEKKLANDASRRDEQVGFHTGLGGWV
jgi:hypothetical protein